MVKSGRMGNARDSARQDGSVCRGSSGACRHGTGVPSGARTRRRPATMPTDRGDRPAERRGGCRACGCGQADRISAQDDTPREAVPLWGGCWLKRRVRRLSTQHGSQADRTSCLRWQSGRCSGWGHGSQRACPIHQDNTYQHQAHDGREPQAHNQTLTLSHVYSLPSRLRCSDRFMIRRAERLDVSLARVTRPDALIPRPNL